MFTDIVDSTAIGVHHGDRTYLDVITQHEEIVRSALSRHVGFVFDSAGDGLLAWFRNPETAIMASLHIIDQVASSDPVLAQLDLAVRIGLADGRPIEQHGALFGTTVNLAARVVDRAPAGALLCTRDVQKRATAGNFSFRSLGGHVLKGFPDPIDLARVEAA